MASNTNATATVAGPAASSATNETVLRNALRYTISAREYAALHKYVLSRSRILRRRVPTVETVHRIMDGPKTKKGSKKKSGGAAAAAATTSTSAAGAAKPNQEGEKSAEETQAALVGADDFNARAVRHALRVFVATGAGMKLYEALQRKLFAKKGGGGGPPGRKKKEKTALRLSLSLSTILLLYRLLFRFFTRLRAHLLAPAALPFRVRNPRTTATLTSPYAPAAGASLAGLALGVAPARFRMMLAVMALCRALEFAWNAAEDAGAIWGVDMVPVSASVSALAAGAKNLAKSAAATVVGENGVLLQPRPRPRPWWWGSWMLQPLAFGQLLHAAVYDRDCFPLPYGDFIFGRTVATDTYLHPPPADATAAVARAWPGPYVVLDALAAMARASWPVFASPVLFPNKEASELLQLPAAATEQAKAAVSAVLPLTSRAHPLIQSLSCATLHPADPSCGRTYLSYWLRAFPAHARFFLFLYTALQLPRLGAVYHAPVAALQRLLARALRSAAFLTGALSTAWASVCFMQTWLPRRVLPTQRFFLGGFVSGLWAFLERRHGRSMFLYSARASLDSVWRVGVKRRWWRSPAQGGDVAVFVASVLLAGVAYERQASAVREPAWRKGISWVRGEGWRDWAVEEEDLEDDENKGNEE